MAAVYVIISHRNPFRRERIFRDRNDPMDYMDDHEIISKFRLPRHLIQGIYGEIENHTRWPTGRSHSLPPSLQVMAALRFLATGSFQTVTAELHGISKASISGNVRDVPESLVKISPRYIKMPTDETAITNTMFQFSRISGFPNVIGAIDGTHVGIKSPSFRENVSMNRKNYHSVNTMAVCDANLKFLNVVAKWPGSSHDSFVWNNSKICQVLENKIISRGWLLGHSGYPLKPYLLTPVLNPTTAKENAYNNAHMKTRNVIERCFGVWKMRFRFVDTSGGALQFSPKRTCNNIVPTAVLHNICIDNKVPDPVGRAVINDGTTMCIVGH
ncbi:putative nuclease HARBI1 [Saccostrea echinata]|uniref:putative nuclease HARBI1 n=1 Tax=Saccostrea echinata TaxID=191078 RepID=UPI002A828BED|nr:putative nuclease HARBI1 [Saccostrea echinata]